MEPVEAALKRHRLILGKFQVIKVDKGLSGIRFELNMGNAVSMKVDCPVSSDVRVGDWLTLYTDVAANADTGQPSE
jgi:hypothetical protein